MLAIIFLRVVGSCSHSPVKNNKTCSDDKLKFPDATQCLSSQDVVKLRTGCTQNLLPLVVSQRDALRGHLEVHDGGSRRRSSSQCLRYGLGDRLRACQGLHLHRVDVEHVACWEDSRCSQSGELHNVRRDYIKMWRFSNRQRNWEFIYCRELQEEESFWKCFCFSFCFDLFMQKYWFPCMSGAKKSWLESNSLQNKSFHVKNILPVTFKKPDRRVNRQIS